MRSTMRGSVKLMFTIALCWATGAVACTGSRPAHSLFDLTLEELMEIRIDASAPAVFWTQTGPDEFHELKAARPHASELARIRLHASDNSTAEVGRNSLTRND
jgi:hypothetical protein